MDLNNTHGAAHHKYLVVSFINNDPRHPVILGGLYTKATKPYTDIKAKNEKKAIVSKEKLTLEFDEKQKAIVIKTSNKNMITISEKDKGITIEDENGNEIKTSKSGISINSKKKIMCALLCFSQSFWCYLVGVL